MHKLYYIDRVDEFIRLTDDEINGLRLVYSESELQNISSSVRWAIENGYYDFSSLLPNIRHSNEDVYKYLCKLYRSSYNWQ